MSMKSEIRNAALKRRDALAPDLREAYGSRLAVLGPQMVAQFAAVADPVVSLYSPIGSEPDIGPMALALHAQGVQLALPVDWSSGSPLVYRRWSPGDRLAIGPLGIAEPLDTAEVCLPDIMFTPLAAFDRRGNRIGYGVGNVDRTIERLRSEKAFCSVGVAFAAQEEAWLPVEPHDQALDIVVTERETMPCRI